MHRIGFLSGGLGNLSSPGIEAFRAGLREHGYIEGQTIAVEWRFADTRLDHLPALAAELAGLDVAVLVADGAPAVRAAQQTTGVLPIVAIWPLLNDPVAAGYVASLARPGGNITGVIGTAGPELWSKRLTLLKEAVPDASRLAWLWDAGQIGPFPQQEPWVAEVARATGHEILALEVREPEDFEGAFAAAVAGAVDWLAVSGSVLINSQLKRVADLALSSRLPATSDAARFADVGGLMAYAADPVDLYRRAAAYVDRVLNGANPAELPVEQPRQFEFVINLKTAQALGKTIPAPVLAQATKVIQ